MSQALTGLSGMSGMLAPSGPVTVLSDHFTGTNGTAITAHTMDVGPGWAETYAGTTTLNNNKARSSNDAASLTTSDSGKADVTISSIVNIVSGGVQSSGLIARFTDASNYWRLTIKTGSTQFQLTEISAGTPTVRASASVTINVGTSYTVQLVCSGTTITGTINGGNQISYGSATSNQTATKHGMYYANANQTTDFDDFLVTSP